MLATRNSVLVNRHILNLEPLGTEVEKWLYVNFPNAIMFFDYASILPSALEVVFGMTTRKELMELDLLGINGWGMPSTLAIQFRELVIRRLEDLCLDVTGERVHHGDYSFRLVHRYMLIVVEIW